MIRQAREEDISSVSEIYELIHTEEEQGRLCIGWQRGKYPTLATARDAFEKGELFVCEREGRIVASAVLNKMQHGVYALGDWKNRCEDSEVMVMHTLTVSPLCMHGGAGREFARFYEEYALKCGCRELRIDTQAKNTAARALYKKLGYTEVGIVPCEFNGITGISLVLLEKTL